MGNRPSQAHAKPQQKQWQRLAVHLPTLYGVVLSLLQRQASPAAAELPDAPYARIMRDVTAFVRAFVAVPFQDQYIGSTPATLSNFMARLVVMQESLLVLKPPGTRNRRTNVQLYKAFSKKLVGVAQDIIDLVASDGQTKRIGVPYYKSHKPSYRAWLEDKGDDVLWQIIRQLQAEGPLQRSPPDHDQAIGLAHTLGIERDAHENGSVSFMVSTFSDNYLDYLRAMVQLERLHHAMATGQVATRDVAEFRSRVMNALEDLDNSFHFFLSILPHWPNIQGGMLQFHDYVSFIICTRFMEAVAFTIKDACVPRLAGLGLDESQLAFVKDFLKNVHVFVKDCSILGAMNVEMVRALQARTFRKQRASKPRALNLGFFLPREFFARFGVPGRLYASHEEYFEIHFPTHSTLSQEGVEAEYAPVAVVDDGNKRQRLFGGWTGVSLG